MSIKPFTLNYFVLSTLCQEASGLDLHELKDGLLKSAASETEAKVIKNGSLYGTLSKLRSAGCIRTSIDIVLNTNGDDLSIKRYFITGKGKSVLYPAIKHLQQEVTRTNKIDFSDQPTVRV